MYDRVKVDKRGFLGLKGHIMRNIASVVAVAAATFFSPAPATAENGQIAAGVAGGLIGGALLGGARVTPCSTAAGLLCARGGIRRRARVPVRSRTLLGRLRLGIPPRRGLRLIVLCIDHRLPRKM